MFTHNWFTSEFAEAKSETLTTVNSQLVSCCDIPILSITEYGNIHGAYANVAKECKDTWLYRKDQVIKLQASILQVITPIFLKLINSAASNQLAPIKKPLPIPTELSQKGLTDDLVIELLLHINSLCANEQVNPETEGVKALNGMSIILAGEIYFLGGVKSTEYKALEDSVVNDGRIYAPIAAHTYQQDCAWMLAHFHHGVQDIVVWDDIVPENMLRTTELHVNELTGFARELALAIKCNYQLIDIDKLHEAEQKNGAKYILRYHGQATALQNLTLYDVCMKDEEVVKSLMTIVKQCATRRDWIAEFSNKVVLCKFAELLKKATSSPEEEQKLTAITSGSSTTAAATIAPVVSATAAAATTSSTRSIITSLKADENQPEADGKAEIKQESVDPGPTVGTTKKRKLEEQESNPKKGKPRLQENSESGTNATNTTNTTNTTNAPGANHT